MSIFFRSLHDTACTNLTFQSGQRTQEPGEDARIKTVMQSILALDTERHKSSEKLETAKS